MPSLLRKCLGPPIHSLLCLCNPKWPYFLTQKQGMWSGRGFFWFTDELIENILAKLPVIVTFTWILNKWLFLKIIKFILNQEDPDHSGHIVESLRDISTSSERADYFSSARRTWVWILTSPLIIFKQIHNASKLNVLTHKVGCKVQYLRHFVNFPFFILPPTARIPMPPKLWECLRVTNCLGVGEVRCHCNLTLSPPQSPPSWHCLSSRGACLLSLHGQWLRDQLIPSTF